MDQPTVLFPGRRRPALGTAAAALVVLIGLGLLVAGGHEATAFDNGVKHWLTDWISLGTARTFADFGSPLVVGVVAVVAAAAFAAGRWFRSAILVVCAPVVAVALVDLVAKPLFGRTMGGVGGALSYPSGHTAAVTALACAVLVSGFGPGAWLFGPVRKGVGAAVCVLAVLCCAAGLTVAGDHYFTDTIGGAALAVATTLGLAVAIDALAATPGPVAPGPVRPAERTPR